MGRPVCVVVGAGSGLGAAIAQRFARAGFAVAICARSRQKLEALAGRINEHIGEGGGDKGKQLQQQALLQPNTSDHGGDGAAAASGGFVRPFPMDASSEHSVNEAFASIRSQLGPVRVLVYNAAQRKFRTENVLEVDPQTVENFWRVNTMGALLCARQALPDMLAATCTTDIADASGGPPLTGLHKGTILFTGASASLRCLAGLTSMSIGKFGLRALAQGMAREFQSKGVHVAHVIIDGAVDSELLRSYVKGQLAKGAVGSSFSSASKVLVTPGTESTPFAARFLLPDAVAEEYYKLHTQHVSTWSQEIDLRPHVEPIMARL